LFLPRACFFGTRAGHRTAYPTLLVESFIVAQTLSHNAISMSREFFFEIAFDDELRAATVES
jgi:hypothetical protein